MTVYVLSPDHDKPSGGIKILYRHVDVLAANGIEAAVLHQSPGFGRCNWFANSTRVEYLQQLRLGDRDFLVIPEIYGPNMALLSEHPSIGRSVRKVIFNQNCRYTFLGQTVEGILSPGFRMVYNNHDEYAGAMVVSEDSRNYLQSVFPGLNIWRIHNAINTQLFSYAPDKKKQLCFMPRKNPDDALQVLGILRLRGVLDDYRVVAIDGMDEQEVARVMKESRLFLSFGYPEGCPLPPAEAMACGCVVAGYDGFGGREYFKSDFSRPVAVGDIVGYADTVERLVSMHRTDPVALDRLGKMASDYIRETYSPRREQDDILAVWRELAG